MKLSAYNLACGYIERKPAYNGADVVLWMEHGVYHARRTDWHGNPKMWLSARTLTEARKAVSYLRGAINAPERIRSEYAANLALQPGTRQIGSRFA